jgi:hypothetical protein
LVEVVLGTGLARLLLTLGLALHAIDSEHVTITPRLDSVLDVVDLAPLRRFTIRA